MTAEFLVKVILPVVGSLLGVVFASFFKGWFSFKGRRAEIDGKEKSGLYELQERSKRDWLASQASTIERLEFKRLVTEAELEHEREKSGQLRELVTKLRIIIFDLRADYHRLQAGRSEPLTSFPELPHED